MGEGFWIILGGTGLYGVLHSILAANFFKKFLSGLVGTGKVAKYHRFVYSMVGGLTLLPLLAAVVLIPDGLVYRIPSPWSILTILIQLGAGAGFLAALYQTGLSDFLGLRRILLDEASAAESLAFEELATGGMYAWVRHPLYFFGMVIMWAMPVMTWNTLGLFIGATLYLLIGSRLEERKLVEQFGEAYQAYQRRTPWMLPTISKK